jgi:hypothetical protein
MTKVKPGVEHIQAGVSFGKASGAIMEVVKSENEPDSLNANQTSQLPYAKWGKDNKFPQRYIDETKKDSVSRGAIEFKISAHYGLGPYLYKRIVTPDKKKIIIEPILLEALEGSQGKEIQDFWFFNDIENFSQQNITQFEWFYHHYVQYITNKSSNRILQVKSQRCKDVRVGKRHLETGEIEKYFISPYFGLSTERTNIAEVPAFDRFNPFKVPNGLYQHNVPSIDRDYYPDAPHQANNSWVRLAIKIPIWIISAIDNSVNIKYHIEIPEKYFTDLFKREAYNSEQEWIDAMRKHEEELKIKIDECLAGSENPMKIFYTKFTVDKDNKQMPGWKINAIPNDIKDSAWLNAYATAAVATLSGHGVSATVTNLSLPSALNVGSGSDTREKFNFHMQLRTVIPRQTTTEWWEIVKRANGWDPALRLGYQNVILETLDNNPKGTRTETEEDPTSKNKD